MESTDIKKVSVSVIGRDVTMCYFVCPKCGSLEIVQADDEATRLLKDELADKMRMVAKYRAKNQSPPKKLLKRGQALHKLLPKCRQELARQIKGSIVFIEGKSIEVNVVNTDDVVKIKG